MLHFLLIEPVRGCINEIFRIWAISWQTEFGIFAQFFTSQHFNSSISGQVGVHIRFLGRLECHCLCDTDSSTVLDACSASFSSNHNILSIFEFVPEMLQTDDSNANEDSSKMCCDGS